MHLQINRKKIYFYIFSLLFLSTIFNQNLFLILKKKFLIQKIEITTNSPEIIERIKFRINYISNSNIFFLKKDLILDSLNKLDFLENIKIKKKYPSTIIINANKTNLIAITYLKQDKYFVGENGKFISSSELKNSNKLPIIFGKFDIADYVELKNILNTYEIDQNKISKFYFHKNKRWDLYYENNIVIMLPNKNVEKALLLLNNFKKHNHIKSGTKIDLRITERLVLKNE